jgi:RHS repeat-associated protein
MGGQTLSYAYIPLPGGMTEYKPNNSTYRLWHKDWIGNARVIADLTGTIQEGSAISPYGEIESQNSYGSLTNEFSFTGDTQDLTAGLFDTPMRELNQSEGRWISPDPAGASWNAYAYPTNPNTATDPTGAMQFYHTDCYCSGNGSGEDPGDFYDNSSTNFFEYGAGSANPSSNHQMASQPRASNDGTANGQSQAETAQNQSNATERIVMGIEGAANLFVAKEIAEVTAGLALATPESGPAIAATATAATLGTISTLSSAMTGTAQILGAITGKTEEANKAAEGLAASTSVFGFITTVVTGDTKKGAAAASIEGIATSSFNRDLFKSGAKMVDAAVNIFDLVSPPPAPPSPPLPGPPPTN